MKKTLFAIVLAAAFVQANAQKIDELAAKPQESFNKEWIKAVRYGIQPTKYFKPKEDGSGTIPFLSKLPGVPKKIALVTFYVYDEGQIETSYNYIYKTSVSETGGNMFSNNFLRESIEGIKSAFASRGMQVMLPEEYLDTEEKKQQYRSFVPNMSGFTKVMEKATKVGDGSAAAADNFQYMYLSDGMDFRLSESMGDKLCNALGVDAVLSVVNHCSTDGRYFALKKVSMIMHGPNPIKPIAGHKYMGAMGAGYQSGHLYQANWVDASFLFMEKHPKKGVLFETYKGYDRITNLLAGIMADNVAARCQGKLGDLKGN